MTITDDRIIYDGLTRGNAIKFLVEKGYDLKKLRAMNDDGVATCWDIEHRKDDVVSRLFYELIKKYNDANQRHFHLVKIDDDKVMMIEWDKCWSYKICKMEDGTTRLKEWEKEKSEQKEKEIRAKVPFTDAELDAVANSLSKKEVFIYFDDDSEDHECEDDGYIHVTRMGVRFCREGKESELPSFARNVEKKLQKLKEAHK
jgi:hypothetical protein